MPIAAALALLADVLVLPYAGGVVSHVDSAAPSVRTPYEDPMAHSRLTIDSLTSDPHNANRGTKRGREALEQSLRELGAGRSIVTDKNGAVIAGNKTVERARELGIPLLVVRTDGTKLVAVQRIDLDLNRDRRAQQLAIADNRINELDLQWDVDTLRQLQADGLDLSAFWTDQEFAELVGTSPGLANENAVIEPGPTTIRPGDLFELGPHRLLCGDATSADDVNRLLAGASPLLMVTDPPYGVDYRPAWRHHARPGQRTAVGAVMNDKRAEWPQAWKLFPGSIAYVWHAGVHAAVVARDLEDEGFSIRSQIIWAKQHFALSRGDYHWQHEPCWYAVRGKGTWRGDRSQSTLWHVPNLNPIGGSHAEEDAVTGHGTQKPVQLFEIPIRNHTVEGDAIYDPFLGSGTSLIAAEKTRRVFFGMDLDPRYVQVALSRWETYAGRKARRLRRARSAQ